MTQDRRITDKLPGHPLQWDDNAGAARAASPSAAPAAGQAGLAKPSVLDLPGAIMNIRCRRADDTFLNEASRLLYKEGHRDARHDAADLVLKRADELATLAAPVAADTEQASKDAEDLIAAATQLREVPHWAAQASVSLLAEIAGRMLKAAPLATPADAGVGLTNDEIMDIAEPFHDINGVKFDEVSFARALLARHVSGQPLIGKLMDQISQLPHLFPDGCQEPGALLRQSDVQRVLVNASKAAACLPAPAVQTKAPDFRNVTKVERYSDQSVRLVFTSCRAASEFEARAIVSQSPAPVTAEPAPTVKPWTERMGVSINDMVWPHEAWPHVKAEVLELRAAVAKVAHSAPADRDAIRDHALEDAAGVVLKLTAVPRDVLGPATAQMKALAANGEKLADRIRALKSMERAADAKGGAA
ncbi:hypothetical protein [Massilia sp. UBA6681]|uniref:hypothetical protein n=1 Tax=Massilia sp. UBA6681 TaxID=1946839 RepID=UPI0025BC7749|nr:hypothetical protein [Massilia sp. UBA6681]